MLPHHLVKDKFKVTDESNKIKPQNHHDSEIKVKSSHKPDKNGKIFLKKGLSRKHIFSSWTTGYNQI